MTLDQTLQTLNDEIELCRAHYVRHTGYSPIWVCAERLFFLSNLIDSIHVFESGIQQAAAFDIETSFVNGFLYARDHT